MPELNWYWGYVATLAVMLIVAIGMIVFFWRRGWFKSFAAVRGDRQTPSRRGRH